VAGSFFIPVFPALEQSNRDTKSKKPRLKETAAAIEIFAARHA
jgi:hypothetical protein